MRFTDSLIKTRRESGKKVESINADLLIRGNFIDQVMAGVYSYLPLGLKVLKKIENIVRDEMNKAGGQETLMPSLQPKENWQKTGRWENLDDLFRFTSYYSKTDLALGPTHEEIVAPLAKKFIQSYKDLPVYLYQIQNKFRDEKRAKAGLLRGREFLMKDLYSFHTDENDLDRYYEIMKNSYQNIFNRVGIGEKTYYTFASGGSFSKFSHEFQTESASGEDIIYLCERCKIAINKEVIEDQNVCPECKSKELLEIKSIEVGNIFKLRTKYSKPFDLKFNDPDGKEKLVEMGCYGIGLGRLMGAVVEVSHDEKGIIWPRGIAPYDIHLVQLDGKTEEAGKIYDRLHKNGFEVLWDDRDESTGVKLADADLIGIPVRLVISNKSIAAGKIEVKYRNTNETKMLDIDEIIKGLNVK